MYTKEKLGGRKKGEESQSQIDQKIQQKLKKTLEELNVVTKEALRAIEQRLDYLEKQAERDS
ncbi:hypothetical protein [Paraliobacillus sp. JSM ZJ581]|uniref:hypothetical protein n=1 Tax=Paraliobacillus sp. JSM ZJ581 TaxID=3342118 RepID=UPI0035A94A69